MTTTELGWQLDEGGARGYEANLVATFLDDWAVDLVARLAPRAGEALLDVGTGTGIVPRRAAEHLGPDGTIDAVDVNPNMLAVATELCAGLEPSVAFRQGRAEALPYDDASFDIVTAQQMLQFTDAPVALAEMARVARPGARLGVSTCRSLDHQPGYRALVATLERVLGVSAADIIASPYALGDSRELVALAEAAGFADVATIIAVTSTRFPSAAAFLRAETASSPLGDVTTSLDVDVLGALIDELEVALAPHRDDEGIVFPFETVTVTATRG